MGIACTFARDFGAQNCYRMSLGLQEEACQKLLDGLSTKIGAPKPCNQGLMALQIELDQGGDKGFFARKILVDVSNTYLSIGAYVGKGGSVEALAYERLPRSIQNLRQAFFSRPLIHRATELRPAFPSIHSTPLQIGRV